VLGVDLSGRMLERARQRAREQGLGHVSFVQADAQVHEFAPASFDVAVSRTGAMFFGDPVAAFSNVGSALRPDGRLALLVWQSQEHNDWVTEFSRAFAAGREIPAPPADAPGPFSFADPARGRSVPDAAGFADVTFTGVHEAMWFGRDADAAYAFVRGLGFTEYMLRVLVDVGRAGALAALRASIDAHARPDGVVYPSAMWLVTAHTRT
jgi:SAM-dependent methyltransferase